MRCIAKADGLWSREGKPILGVPHINECLTKLFEDNPDLILDGELYNHAFKDDFNSIISACKKQTPTEEEKARARDVIQYHVYDVPSEGKFADRIDYLQTLPFDSEHLHKVETLMINIDHVDEFAASFIEDGYEGAMVRLNDLYENKRSKSLIKWKEMTDEEFPIVEVLEGEGGRAGIAASVVCGLGDGSTFRAGIIGNVDFCREMLSEKDRYIGKLATIVFQNYTPDGKPRFAKFKAVRDYE
jgi:DNA ligase-1